MRISKPKLPRKPLLPISVKLGIKLFDCFLIISDNLIIGLARKLCDQIR